MTSTDKFIIDIGYFNMPKDGQFVPGDVYVAQKTDGYRTVCTLADGLGSGIKANVLGTITATMATKFVSEDINMKKAAEIIMSTLPVCSERKISYSTFSVLDANENGQINVIEYDNPGMVVVRKNRIVNIEKDTLKIENQILGGSELHFSKMKLKMDDRIIFFTDGVTQCGMGKDEYPYGWGQEGVEEFILEVIENDPEISSRDLAREIVNEASKKDSGLAKDDISCMVAHSRQPCKMLIATGPPFYEEQDRVLASTVNYFEGVKVICGGTTANIISRELDREVETDISILDPEIPPPSIMEGIDLITDGALTLNRVAMHLKEKVEPEKLKNNAATTLFKMLLEADDIHFVVGTKINEAHQDPNLPAELDIRRNLIRRIVRRLKRDYMKKASFELI